MTRPTIIRITVARAAVARATVRRRLSRSLLAAAAMIAAAGVASTPAPLAAQAAAVAPDVAGARALAERVGRSGSGTVRFSFAAREGVCGTGRYAVARASSEVEWESDCESGPVRLSLTVRDGAVTEVRSYIGGRWRADLPSTDLGTVPAPAAAAYLLDLAARLPAGPATDAVFPATLADGVTTWPALLRLARDESRPERVRQQAVFWVGQAAGEEASRGLTALVDERDADLKIREHAVFALSQRAADESVPALIRIARTSPSPRLRKRAIFWLGQSKDPRALAYFEEVLGK
ncbi:MAG TPA: HEAT repeat domain-containing protein [Gemmatimonadaceae bacterium]|nr:HEAT repeat domain-containing protein [Gemmatimonadaceae bacterium]